MIEYKTSHQFTWNESIAKPNSGSVKSMVSRGSQAPWKENKCKYPGQIPEYNPESIPD